jgi:hypothetical protein
MPFRCRRSIPGGSPAAHRRRRPRPQRRERSPQGERCSSQRTGPRKLLRPPIPAWFGRPRGPDGKSAAILSFARKIAHGASNRNERDRLSLAVMPRFARCFEASSSHDVGRGGRSSGVGCVCRCGQVGAETTYPQCASRRNSNARMARPLRELPTRHLNASRIDSSVTSIGGCIAVCVYGRALHRARVSEPSRPTPREFRPYCCFCPPTLAPDFCCCPPALALARFRLVSS